MQYIKRAIYYKVSNSNNDKELKLQTSLEKIKTNEISKYSLKT